MTLDPIYSGHGSIFFEDQQIFSQDLNNIEHSKLRIIRESLVAMMYQPGVAIDSLSDTALKVIYIDTEHFTINPGVAIDSFGRLIYVPSDTSASGSTTTDPYYHPVWPSRQNIVHNQLPEAVTTYYVNIYYTMQQDIAETDDKKGAHYTREYDSYRIACENSIPSDDSDGICLASFQVDTDGDIVGGSGSINDIRPLLLFGLQTAAFSAREVFRQASVASNVVNNDAGSNSWQESLCLGPDPVSVPKARVSFMYYGETTMNVHFLKLALSDSGSLLVSVDNNTGGSGSYDFNNTGSNDYYSFSFSLNAAMNKDIFHYITIYLETSVCSSAAIVGDTVIDVI